MKHPAHAKRGRPQKFGRPSQVVALTLPEEVVRGLHKVHSDLAWAIVTLYERLPNRASGASAPQRDAELVRIAERRSLIVVNRTVVKSLPGINIVPLTGDRAFLALEPGRGMADLELAVIDRLADPSVAPRERQALVRLRSQLRIWRHDRALRFHTRAIIVVERTNGRQRGPSARRGVRYLAASGTNRMETVAAGGRG
jgi:hypothetical protein